MSELTQQKNELDLELETLKKTAEDLDKKLKHSLDLQNKANEKLMEAEASNFKNSTLIDR